MLTRYDFDYWPLRGTELHISICGQGEREREGSVTYPKPQRQNTDGSKGPGLDSTHAKNHRSIYDS